MLCTICIVKYFATITAIQLCKYNSYFVLTGAEKKHHRFRYTVAQGENWLLWEESVIANREKHRTRY